MGNKLDTFSERLYKMVVADQNKGGNYKRMQLIAIDSWAATMPVSYAVQECLNHKVFRPFMKRHIEAIYDGLDADYDALFWE